MNLPDSVIPYNPHLPAAEVAMFHQRGSTPRSPWQPTSRPSSWSMLDAPNDVSTTRLDLMNSRMLELSLWRHTLWRLGVWRGRIDRISIQKGKFILIFNWIFTVERWGKNDIWHGIPKSYMDGIWPVTSRQILRYRKVKNVGCDVIDRFPATWWFNMTPSIWVPKWVINEIHTFYLGKQNHK